MASLLMVRQTLEQRLIYGSYPEIVSNPNNAKELLMGIAGSYLYKDILSMEGIRKPALLEKLLVALASWWKEVFTNDFVMTRDDMKELRQNILGITPVVSRDSVKGIYDLKGNRVTNPKHGLYIIDGKKMWIK